MSSTVSSSGGSKGQGDEPRRTLLDPDLVDRLRGLSLRPRRRAQGAVGGPHRSSARGAGVEFVEHEEYSPGSDLRRVDWRAFGRLDRFHLKRFEERTERTTLLAVDSSRSMAYRGSRAPCAKIDQAARIAAAFAHVVAAQGDPVGLLFFPGERSGGRAKEKADAAGSLLAPSARPGHLHEVLRRLQTVDAAGPATDLQSAAQRAGAAAARRGLVVLVSDLQDFSADPRQILAWLRRRHEVIVLAVGDPDEEDLPWEGPVVAEALEGAQRETVDPDALRAAFREEVERFRAAWRSAATDSGADLRFVRTDEPMLDLVGAIFSPGTGRLV